MIPHNGTFIIFVQRIVRMKQRFYLTLLLLFGCVSLQAGAVDSLLNTMTRREKIAQIIFEAVETQESPEKRDMQRKLVREGLGGIIVMDDPLVPDMQLINELQGLARIPMLVSIDGEWGAAMRFYEFSAFPRAMQLGALDDEGLVEQAGRAIGEERLRRGGRHCRARRIC